MPGDPRVIPGHVVRHEIEDEPEPSFGKLFSGNGQTLPAPQMVVDHVSPHTIRGPHVVFRTKIRKGPPEVFKKALVPVRNGDTRGAPFPDAHEPQGVKAPSREGVPLLPRDGRQIHRLLVFQAEFPQPDPGVDLVDERMFRPWIHFSPYFFNVPWVAVQALPASRYFFASSSPKSRISAPTSPVQPVWWLAPMPAPLSP